MSKSRKKNNDIEVPAVWKKKKRPIADAKDYYSQKMRRIRYEEEFGVMPPEPWYEKKDSE